MKENILNIGGLKQNSTPMDVITRYERVAVSVQENESAGILFVAEKIAEALTASNINNRPFVLGLTSGTTFDNVFRELIKKHKTEGLSFKNVIVFNLEEFYGIDKSSALTRANSLKKGFLDHIDILPENINLLDTSIPYDKVEEYCDAYDRKIEAVGGIDLQLLGIGATGYIGFNEPGNSFNTATRVVALDNATRKDNLGGFSKLSNVPSQGLTMGMASILKAKKVLLAAWGECKSEILAKAVEGAVLESVPVSYLQKHSSAEIVVDMVAAAALTRFKTPWLVGSCDWSDKFVRKAIVWLSQTVGKPVLKLTKQDYLAHNLGELLAGKSTYYEINIKVFNDLQHTITGWPGGKPNSDDTTRPERAEPAKKRIIIFSPHPDDDVISMGGTFQRLVAQGHEVHIAYQTSGNIAVLDDVVLQFLDGVKECGYNSDAFNKIEALVKSKVDGEVEPLELRKLKGSLRRSEAKAACRHFGIVDEKRCHFLNLPFYETGAVKKNGIGKEDVEIVKTLIDEIKPHQIYAAGDLRDPHGTHKVCIEAILAAIDEIKHKDYMKDCRLWLYRGAWQEWELELVDMAVPISPEEVMIKRHAIFKHLSQKDNVPFPGDDDREFWQRAEERTAGTAKQYKDLGMAEYQAIEVFVRYDFYS